MDEKDQLTKIFMKAAEEEISEHKFKHNRMHFWWNVRSKKTGGLRLTDFGFKYITEKAGLKSYAIDLPKNLSLSPQILIWLDNFIESPYHLTKKKITVFKEKSAFELYLFAGDVKKLGYTKAMAKRIDQN